MRCLHARFADGPDFDVPVLDYLLLLVLFLACIAPVFVLR